MLLRHPEIGEHISAGDAHRLDQSLQTLYIGGAGMGEECVAMDCLRGHWPGLSAAR